MTGHLANIKLSETKAGTLRLEDLFNLDEIQQLQDAFAQATGVASIITDPAGIPITRPSNFCNLCQLVRSSPKGLANCMHSDAVLGRRNNNGPVVQPCLSGGLLDGGTSIVVEDQHIANWLIGQVLDSTADDANMLEYARLIGVDEDSFHAALPEVRRMSSEQFAHICNALFLLARLLSNLAVRNLNQARFLEERQRAEQERLALQEQVIEAQQAALRELSTPLIPVTDGVVVMPIIGSVDSKRAQQILETLLEGVSYHQALIAIIDITGVKVVDTQVAGALLQAARAASLLGAQVVLTGISPEIAQTLVHIGADLSGITTLSSLQRGIAFALSKRGNAVPGITGVLAGQS